MSQLMNNAENSTLAQKIARWFKNYWYYYKLYIIGGALLLALIVYGVTELTGKTEADIRLYVVTTLELDDSQLDPVGEYVWPYADDVNGDGTLATDIYDMQLSPNDTSDTAMTKYYQLLASISEDNVQLLIVDDYTYDYLKNLNGIASLSDYGLTGMLADGTQDDERIYLNGTGIVDSIEAASARTLSDGSEAEETALYLCLKVREEGTEDDETMDARYASAVAFAAYAAELAAESVK